jgi:NADPH:quinone reductase-like Zn-dependent oxidoreductase
MQAYSIDKFGDVSGLILHERARPEPGPREVLVRVHATSVNYRDLMVLDQTYPVPSKVGTIPLSDGAGEVVAVGPHVSRFAVGERVAGIYFNRWLGGRLTAELAGHQLGSSHDGMLAEYRTLHEDSLVMVPGHLTFEEAATLPCAALTGWSCVNGGRPVLPGESVLIVGGGGVALFATQFAKLLGVHVIAVTTKADKVPLLQRLGANDVVVSADDPDWHRHVLALTGGRGVDHVVEAVGPATLGQSLRASAFDADIALAGVFAGEHGFDPRALIGRLVTIRRVSVGSRAAFEAMNRAIALHRLTPVIDRVFPFSEARAAYERFAAMSHTGKVVIAGPQ